MRKWKDVPTQKLTECVKMVVQRPGTKAREFRLCAVGGHGHAAQLQVMTPGPKDIHGDTPQFIVGNSQKACKLTWPLIAYAKDYSPEVQAGIRELHGPAEFLEKLFGKKKAKRNPMSKRIMFVPGRGASPMSRRGEMVTIGRARRRRRRRR